MDGLELLALALGVGLVTPLAAALARRRGLGDAARGAHAGRKAQRGAVPTVGGPVLLAVLVLATWSWSTSAVLDPSGWLGLGEGPNRWLLWGSLCASVGLGLLDDLLADGLAPLPKVFGQVLVSVPLALVLAPAWGLGGAPGLLAGVLAGVAAMNVANTFDNHDGALAAVGLVGLAAPLPAAAAALAGFLPWNLDAEPWRGGRPSDEGASPTSYLGDAGSHLIGVLALLQPAAWALLLLPALDLARLSVVRASTGSAPWVGDRRHLAHRLQRRGWSRRRVALALALASVPACLGAARAVSGAGALWGQIGPLGTLAAAGLLWWTSRPAVPR